MNRVYIIQKPVRVTKDTEGNVKGIVPLFDTTPALQYGRIVTLFDAGAISLYPERVVQVLEELLKGFDDDDHLLPTGDTVLVAAAAAIAAANNDGRYKILRWDKRDGGQYKSLQYDIKEER